MAPFLLFLTICALALQLASPLLGQQVVSARAGLITLVQGSASVDGKHALRQTAYFLQLKDGETLATARGRVELLLAPGAVFRIGENSEIRMEDTHLADTRVTLQKGDALLEIWQLPDGNRIQVRLGDTVTELTRTGLYRFGTAQNTLRVYGGEAIVRSGSATATAKRGMAVDLDAKLAVNKFDRKQTDLLHAWAARRSFDLFMSDPDARRNQTHWGVSRVGYVENSNFGVEFRTSFRPRPGIPVWRPPVPKADSR
jgi:hypothetical protein